MKKEEIKKIIQAISDLRDEAVVYGMRLEENEGHAVCCCGDEVDNAITNLVKLIGIEDYCIVRNTSIIERGKK